MNAVELNDTERTILNLDDVFCIKISSISTLTILSNRNIELIIQYDVELEMFEDRDMMLQRLRGMTK